VTCDFGPKLVLRAEHENDPVVAGTVVVVVVPDTVFASVAEYRILFKFAADQAGAAKTVVTAV
jgi:hypothetical protein